MTFVFSSDSHLVEPRELFDDNLPATLKKHGIRSERQGDHICTMAGEKILHRTRIIKRETPPPAENGDNETRGLTLGQGEDVVRLHAPARGHNNIELRLEDMKLDGIDAEISFPSTCLWAYGIEHPETELATAQIYNDWNDKLLGGRRDVFIRCGVLPVRDFNNTIAELKRLAQKGFTSAMIPCVTPSDLPKYNDEAWDPVFELAGDLGIVLVMHSGTGLETVQPERRAGGAVINYTNQACDAWNAIQYLVAGGLLDRYPKAQVAVIECGASWLAGLVERMDEIYVAHGPYVRPKLSLMPSEIVARQVSCGFQNDRACILTRSITGVKPLIWGSDYPHAEGTYPRSKDVINRLFAGIEISDKDKADIVGGNAARLFRLQRPEFAVGA